LLCKFAIDAGNLAFPAPNKVPLGDSNESLERPWGEYIKLKSFWHLENVSKKDGDYHFPKLFHI